MCFNIREAALSDIFLRYCNTSLLQKIWIEQKNGGWNYNGRERHINGGKFSLQLIYKFLAIKVYIQCTMEEERAALSGRRPLRSHIEEALDHFSKLVGKENIKIGISIIESLLSRFLFSKEYFDDISAGFLSFVRNLGEFVCGDEKLAHFTGVTPDKRYCPNKPAKIGLWFYQLTSLINEDSVYLIDLSMWAEDEETMNCVTIIGRWMSIMENFAHDYESCCLVFDSYYLDNSGRELMIGDNVRYCAGVNKQRFPKLVELVEENVQRPGEFAAVYNEDTNEQFLFKYDKDKKIGKRFVMGNVLQHEKDRASREGESILFDFYKETFSVCDKLNQEMHDKTWPHKHGGFSRLGDPGEQNEYAFTTMLLNTFNLFRSLFKLEESKMILET